MPSRQTGTATCRCINRPTQQPQRLDDPRFTHSFSRHRRIDDDRWTLRAARFSPWPVVQACRRDMPCGFGELVRDVSAPVTVLGRRWGAAQIASSMDLDD
jgi:methyl-accepting chemotaxis protein